MMNWKEKALHAADAQAALDREAERIRKETEQARQVEAFQLALSELLEEEIILDALEAWVDGVAFRWALEPIGRTYGIVLQGTCPDCGASTWSGPIRSLADLGALLQRFRPDSTHIREHLNTPKPQNHARTIPTMDRNRT
jgi:hypothetical protein